MWKQVLFVGFLVGAALAGPLPRDESQCSGECSSASQKLRYKPGNTYVYIYQAKISPPTENVNTDVTLEARVEVAVLKQCQLAVQFRDVRLKGPSSDDQQDLKRLLEAEPTVFHHENGRVGDICPSQNQPAYVTNIVRGFLSAFQTDVSVLDDGEMELEEIDVLGKCQTRYSVPKGRWGVMTIKKEKYLDSCTHRHNVSLPVFPVQVAPSGHFAVKSNSECEYVIKDNVIESVKCEDSHRVLLLGQRVQVESTVAITLQETRNRLTVDRVSSTRKTSLLFEHVTRIPTQTKYDAENVMKQLCPLVKSGVEQQAPEVFSHLAHVLSQLTKDDLQTLYHSVKRGSICDAPGMRHLFIDAIASADSGESYAFMASLIKDREISEMHANAFFFLLTVAKNVSENSIEAFLPILKSSKSRHALLGVSTMISRFCYYQNQIDCSENPAVQRAIDTLSRRLTKKCYAPGDEQEQLQLLLLKALGNIGIKGEAADLAMECFVNKHTSEPVRIAAINALRHVPCQPETHKKAMDMLMNEEGPAPIRIVAFMHLMRCPSPDMIKQINEIYQRMQCPQVASFMYSYLTNLQETSDPLKQGMRSMVSDYHFVERFSSSFRNSSRNYEFSKYYKSIFGLTKDINVIFPEKGSFLRYWESNITVDGYGHMHNFAEHSYYMKGGEQLIKQLLEKHGIVKKLYESLPKKLKSYIPEDAVESVLQMLRGQIVDSINEEFKFIFGMRLYGSDVTQISESDIKKIADKIKSMKLADMHYEIIKELAARWIVEATRGFKFLDVQWSTPTLVGMPLKVDINGTVLAGLSLKGKADVSDVENANVDINVTAEPSMAAQLSAHVMVDTYYCQPGKKVEVKIHSSVPVGIQMQLNQNGYAVASLSLPKDSIKLANVTVGAYEVGHDGAHYNSPQSDQSPRYFSKSFKIESLGVELALSIPLSFPSFAPLDGYASFSAEIRKIDPTLQSFEIMALWSPEEVRGVREYIIAFDTPHSSVDRYAAAAIFYEASENGRQMQFLVRTPRSTFQDRIIGYGGRNTINVGKKSDAEDAIQYGRNVEMQSRRRIGENFDAYERRMSGNVRMRSQRSIYEQPSSRYGDEESRKNHQRETYGRTDPANMKRSSQSARGGVNSRTRGDVISVGKEGGSTINIYERRKKSLEYLSGNAGGNYYNFSALAALEPSVIAEVKLMANGANVYSAGVELGKQSYSKQLDLEGRAWFTYGNEKMQELKGTASINDSPKKTKFEMELYSSSQPNTPYLKGKFTKQGSYSLSNPKGSLKLSSDISLKLPFLNTRFITSTSKTDRSIDSNSTLTYQVFKQRSESAMFNIKLVNSGSKNVVKVSASGEVQFTQFPRSNGKFNWDLQMKPRSRYESDLTFCSEEPCKNKANKVSVVCRIEGPNTKAQAKLIVPSKGINYDATMESEKKQNTWNLRALAKNNGKKLAEGTFTHQLISENPLQISSESYLKTPQREMKYTFEHQETERSVKEKLFIQWQRSRSLTAQHEYTKEEQSRSSVRHVYEASVDSSSFPSPLEHRSLMQLSKDAMTFESSFSKSGKQVFDLKSHLSSKNPSRAHLKLEKYELSVDADISAPKKNAHFEIRPVSQYGKRIEGSVSAVFESSSQEIIVDLAWDADKQPDKKLHVEMSSSVRKTDRAISGSLQYSKKLDAKFEVSLGKDIIYGPHKAHVSYEHNRRRRELTLASEIRDGKMKSNIVMKESGQEKLRGELNAKYKKSRSLQDFEGKFELTSALENVEDIKAYVHITKDTQRELNYRGEASLETNSLRKYAVQIDSTFPRSYDVGEITSKMAIQTPIRGYEQLEININAETQLPSVVRGSIEITKNSVVFLYSTLNVDVSDKNNFVELQMRTDTSMFDDIFVQVDVGVRSGYVGNALVRVGQKEVLKVIAVAKPRDISLVIDFQISTIPHYQMEFKGMMNKGWQMKKYHLQIKQDDEDVISGDLELQKESGRIKFAFSGEVQQYPSFGVSLESQDNGRGQKQIEGKVSYMHKIYSMQASIQHNQQRAQGEVHMCREVHGMQKCMDLDYDVNRFERSVDATMKLASELVLELHSQLKEKTKRMDLSVTARHQQLVTISVDGREGQWRIDAEVKHENERAILKGTVQSNDIQNNGQVHLCREIHGVQKCMDLEHNINKVEPSVDASLKFASDLLVELHSQWKEQSKKVDLSIKAKRQQLVLFSANTQKTTRGQWQGEAEIVYKNERMTLKKAFQSTREQVQSEVHMCREVRGMQKCIDFEYGVNRAERIVDATLKMTSELVMELHSQWKETTKKIDFSALVQQQPLVTVSVHNQVTDQGQKQIKAELVYKKDRFSLDGVVSKYNSEQIQGQVRTCYEAHSIQKCANLDYSINKAEHTIDSTLKLSSGLILELHSLWKRSVKRIDLSAMADQQQIVTLSTEIQETVQGRKQAEVKVLYDKESFVTKIAAQCNRGQSEGEAHMCHEVRGEQKCIDFEYKFTRAEPSMDATLKLTSPNHKMKIHSHLKRQDGVREFSLEGTKNEKTVGLLAKCEKTDSEYATEVTVNLLKQSLRFRLKNAELDDGTKQITFEFVPNLEDSSRRVAGHIAYSGNSCQARSCSTQLEVSIVMPKWKKPASLKIHLIKSPRSQHNVELNMEFDFPTRSVDKLMIQAYEEVRKDRTKQEKTYAIRIYDASRQTLDTSAKVSFGSSLKGGYKKVTWSFLDVRGRQREGSAFFSMFPADKEFEIQFHVDEWRYRAAATWEQISHNELEVKVHIESKMHSTDLTLIIKKGSPCNYVVIKDKYEEERAVISACAGLQEPTLFNVSLVSKKEMSPISLSELSLRRRNDGLFDLKIKFPMEHVAEVLDYPTEFKEFLIKSNLPDASQEVERQFRILDKQFQQGLEQPLIEGIRELSNALEEEFTLTVKALDKLFEQLKHSKLVLALERLTETLKPHTEELQKQLNNGAQKAYKAVKEILKHFKEGFKKFCGQLECVNQLVQAVLESEAYQSLCHTWHCIFEQTHVVAKIVEEILCKLWGLCFPESMIESISQVIDDLQRWLAVQHWAFKEHLQTLIPEEILNAIDETVEITLKKMKESDLTIENILEVIKDMLTKLFPALESPSYKVKYYPEKGEVIAQLKIPVDIDTVRQDIAYTRYLLQSVTTVSTEEEENYY